METSEGRVPRLLSTSSTVCTPSSPSSPPVRSGFFTLLSRSSSTPPAKQTSSRTKKGSWMNWKTFCSLLVIHAIVLITFTCGVVMLIGWRNAVPMKSGDGLGNRSHPIGAHPFVLTSPASQFSNPALTLSSRLLSVVASIPAAHLPALQDPRLSPPAYPPLHWPVASVSVAKPTADTDGAGLGTVWLHHLFTVKAAEIRPDNNTTLLWLSDGFVLQVDPGSVKLLRSSRPDPILIWRPPSKEPTRNEEKTMSTAWTSENEGVDGKVGGASIMFMLPEGNHATLGTAATVAGHDTEPLVSYIPYAHDAAFG